MFCEVLPVELAEFSNAPNRKRLSEDRNEYVDLPVDILRLVIEYSGYMPELVRVLMLDQLRDMREFTVHAKNKLRVRNIVIKKYQQIKKLPKFGKLKQIRFDAREFETLPADFEFKNSFMNADDAIQKISEADCLLFGHIPITIFSKLVSRFPMRTKTLSTRHPQFLKYFPELESLGLLAYNTNVLKSVKLPNLRLLELKLFNKKPDLRQILADLSEISPNLKTRIIFRSSDEVSNVMMITKSEDKLKWILLHGILPEKTTASIEYDSEGINNLTQPELEYFEQKVIRLRITAFDTNVYTISTGFEKQNLCMRVDLTGISVYSRTGDEAFKKINGLLS